MAEFNDNWDDTNYDNPDDQYDWRNALKGSGVYPADDTNDEDPQISDTE